MDEATSSVERPAHVGLVASSITQLFNVPMLAHADTTLPEFATPALSLTNSEVLPNSPRPDALPVRDELPTRLIDRNAFVADGTDKALHKLLQHLGMQLQGDIFIAYNMQTGRRLQTASTRPGNYRDSVVSPLIQSALLECSHSDNCLLAMEENATSGVLRNLKQREKAALVLGIGAGKPDDRLGLVLCVADQTRVLKREAYEKLLKSIQSELPDWMETWRICRVGHSVQRWLSFTQFYRRRSGQIAVAALLGFIGCLAIPVPYWPRRECLVEPASRQFLASPIDGRVIDSMVRPGDVVAAGQLLARIDDERIRWDLAAAEAEYQMATKRRDSALATRAGGELRLAQLEQERFEIQIDALKKQLEELEIRSPIAGVVVQGDWHRNEGAPVDRGGTLFEISPLEAMRVEIQLTTEDLGQIPSNSIATMRVDAAHGTSWRGRVSRIDPRGQVVDSKVAFLAEMEVINDNTALRPGMKGAVRLSAGTRTIGWLLFHRPYVWLMKKLAW